MLSNGISYFPPINGSINAVTWIPCEKYYFARDVRSSLIDAEFLFNDNLYVNMKLKKMSDA